MAQWLSTTCRLLVFGVVWLGWINAPLLFAAETFYVSSEAEFLNMWSGPGIEYRVVSRLPHGMKVTVHEYWEQWAKISPAAGVPSLVQLALITSSSRAPRSRSSISVRSDSVLSRGTRKTLPW